MQQLVWLFQTLQCCIHLNFLIHRYYTCYRKTWRLLKYLGVPSASFEVLVNGHSSRKGTGPANTIT